MNKITLPFAHALVEFSIIENIIHIQISGIYTDDVAYRLLEKLDLLVEEFPGDPIRVTDVRGVPAEGFNLSKECIDRLAKWGLQVKTRKPGSIGYLIGNTAISYGMARMYALKTEIDAANIVVVKSIDELPDEVKSKLPR
jgi:hypothetical protein